MPPSIANWLFADRGNEKNISSRSATWTFQGSAGAKVSIPSHSSCASPCRNYFLRFVSRCRCRLFSATGVRRLFIKRLSGTRRNLCAGTDNDLTYGAPNLIDSIQAIYLFLMLFLAIRGQLPEHGTAIASYLAEHVCVPGIRTDQTYCECIHGVQANSAPSLPRLGPPVPRNRLFREEPLNNYGLCEKGSFAEVDSAVNKRIRH